MFEQFQGDVDSTLDDLAGRVPLPAPVSKGSVWTAPFRGITAGTAEALAGASEMMGAVADTGMATRSNVPGVPAGVREAAIQRVVKHEDMVNPVGDALRQVARDYRPDPATAGYAEKLLFDLPRFAGKAVGYTLATGSPISGAALTASDEALTASEDLRSAGVDFATRTKAGTVAGVAAGAGVLMPVAGKTIAGTVGLVVAGGPAAFIAQMTATKAILEHADYADLAAQYDPLDPVGLAVATLIPAGFGAWHLRGMGAPETAPKPEPAARVEPTIAPEPSAVVPQEPSAPALIPTQPELSGRAVEPVIAPDHVDAAMVHNLSLQQDVHEATPPPYFDRIANETPSDLAARLGFEPDKPAGSAGVKPALRPDGSVEGADVAAAGAPVPGGRENLPVAGTGAEGAALTPHVQSVLDRIAQVETSTPDMLVRADESGHQITAAQELSRVREEAMNGTADELGSNDADLFAVAANCFLSTDSV